MSNIVIVFRELSDIEECKRIWKSLVTIETVYDDWDFRVCFYDETNPIHFLTAFDKEIAVGLLPMQFNVKENYLEFFGGNFMENNQIYVKGDYEYLRKDMIDSIKKPARLRCMTPQDKYIASLPIDEDTFKINTENLNNLNSFINKFNSKDRNYYRKSIARVTELNPTITNTREGNLDLLIKLNIDRHGDDSFMCESDICSAFSKLQTSNFNINLQSIIFDGVTQSIAFCLNYRSTYSVLMTGSNREAVNGLGTFEKLKTIEYAIDNKIKYVDFGRGDCNWKIAWKLDASPLYEYKNF